MHVFAFLTQGTKNLNTNTLQTGFCTVTLQPQSTRLVVQWFRKTKRPSEQLFWRLKTFTSHLIRQPPNLLFSTYTCLGFHTLSTTIGKNLFSKCDWSPMILCFSDRIEKSYASLGVDFPLAIQTLTVLNSTTFLVFMATHIKYGHCTLSWCISIFYIISPSIFEALWALSQSICILHFHTTTF